MHTYVYVWKAFSGGSYTQELFRKYGLNLAGWEKKDSKKNETMKLVDKEVGVDLVRVSGRRRAEYGQSIVYDILVCLQGSELTR